MGVIIQSFKEDNKEKPNDLLVNFADVVSRYIDKGGFHSYKVC